MQEYPRPKFAPLTLVFNYKVMQKKNDMATKLDMLKALIRNAIVHEF